MSHKSYAFDFAEHDLVLEKQGVTLVSPQILEKKSFNTVVVHLDETVKGLMVNFGNGWQEVEIHDDGDGNDRLVVTAPTHTVQFLLKDAGSRESLNLKATLFYYDEKDFPVALAGLQASTQTLAHEYKIITRKEWGADEELRVKKVDTTPSSPKPSPSTPYVDPCADVEKNYGSEMKITSTQAYNDEGRLLSWPIKYADKLEKFVVHHTDSEIKDLNGDLVTDTRDYQAIVRAIYYFHTVTRGWGDIGYNYLIDPLGNIYEGRFGGDKAIGAHAQCYNHGTMGIALIGNYQDNEVPDPALDSLIWLIGSKGKQYKIDPSAASTFRGKDLPNVIGHKDVRATSCPGEKLYALLPKIRDRAALAMRNFSEATLSVSEYDYNAEFIPDFSPPALGPGERRSVLLKFKNIGKKAWDNTTWLHVALNNNPNGRLVPIVQDKTFVAADLQEDSVPPGKTGTFMVELEAGFKAGQYAFEVSPVVNGRYKISRAAQYIGFQVQNGNYDYEVVSHDFPKGTVFQGQKILSTLELKNTGNVTWSNYGNNAITLGASEPNDRKSIFVKNNPSRMGYLIDSKVAPGETGHFVLDLSVPEDRTGEVIERFTPVIENLKWLDDKALGFKVIIKKPNHLARTTKIDPLTSMLPGERRFVEVDMLNQGDLPWDASTVGATLLGRGVKVFQRVLISQDTIKPGDTMKLGFWVEAPITGGRASINLRARFNSKDIRGGVAEYAIQIPKSVIQGAKIDQVETAINIHLHEAKELVATFKNTGNTVWKKKGPNAVHLGTSDPIDRFSRFFLKDNWLGKPRAAELEEDEVMPGEVGTFKFKIQPELRGRFTENFQLVMEGITWMQETNVAWQINVSGPLASSEVSPAKTPSKTPSLPRIPEAPTVKPAVKPVTQPPVKTTEKPFRVRLSYDSDTSTFTMDKDFLVFDEKNQAIFDLAAGKTVTTTRNGDSFQLKAGSLTKTASLFRLASKEEGGIVEISSMERRPTWDKTGTLNDNRFRGILEVRVIDKKTVYINELPLEDYVKGLAEVSNGDPTEKLKTIAVLARTYAKFYLSDDNRKFPGLPYDGSDDPEVFQRYLGYGVESRSPNFTAAAEATKDVVVTYKGSLIKTPYFNQSDGRTRSAQEVWGWTTTPYLVSVSDPWSKGLELKGHGVGLSGFGATAQANAGKKYDEIIKYYYTGIEVGTLKN